MQSSRNLVFLINPISGVGNKLWLRRLIDSKTSKAGIPFTIMDTVASGDYTNLRNKVLHGEVTDIIVCGGDGTVSQVAASMYGTKVNIGIIPMGSGNGLAFAAGIPRNVNFALDIIYKGNFKTVDAFLVNDHFSCMLCGLGFDAQVAHDFSKQRRRGLRTYLKLTTINFLKAKPYPFIITDGVTRISTDAFFISIANSNQFGNNVRIAPRASLSDGLLDIVVVNKMSKMRMAYSMLVQLLMGEVMPVAEKQYHKRHIFYFQSKKLVIENPGGAPFHVDGEPAETEPVYTISILENAMRLIQP